MSLITGPLQSFLGRLRFPVLFCIAAFAFVLDTVVPDLIPFADEILLGLGAALLAAWKKRRVPAPTGAQDTAKHSEHAE